MKNLLINLVRPWKDNPSKYENFYEESIEEGLVEKIEENEEIIDESELELVEDVIDESIEEIEPIETTKPQVEVMESKDPYYLILKDLSQ